MYRTIVLAMFFLSQPAMGTSLLVNDNFAGFAATGLSPDGAAGTLDSTLWTISGASDGDTLFGDTHTGGDFARGRSSGGVGSGGVYAFLLPGGETALGVQATGSDFTPGHITRRVVNESSAAVRNLSVALDLWYLNNGSRSTRMTAQWAMFEPGQWSPLPGLQLETPAQADALEWRSLPLFATLPGVLLEAGEALFLSWHFDDLSGTGSRDEIALSGLRLWGDSTVPAVLAGPGTLALGLVMVAALLISRAATRRRLKLE